MDGVFISYRREDSAGYAGRLYDRLVAHFGAERVFMDVEGIDPGTDFVDAIEGAVSSCKVLIVLIGNEWMDVTDDNGRRRLEDPNDFIRLETGIALKRDIRVLPVLLEGAKMPTADNLPDDLTGLSRRQAIEISHKQWEASSRNLIETLDKIFHPDSLPKTARRMSKQALGSGFRLNSIWFLAGLITVLLAGVWFVVRTLPESTQTAAPVVPSALESVPSPPPASTAGRLEAQPLRIDFGTVSVGTTRVASVVLSNSGEANADIPPFLLEDDKTKEITIEHQCPARLTPTESCTIELHFKPRETGLLNTRFNINRADDSSIAITLSAAAVAEPLPPVIEAKPRPPVIAAIAPINPPKPSVKPKILRFSSTVAGNVVKLCYEVRDARQILIKPVPGHLKNLHKDCVSVTIEARTTFKIEARGNNHRVTDSLVATPDHQSKIIPVTPTDTPNTSVSEAITDADLPNVNDQWTYRVSGRWANVPVRTIEISVLSVDPQVVKESLTQIVAGSRKPLNQRIVQGPTARVIQSNPLGSEFSPYLMAYDGLQSESNWRSIPTPDINSFWTDWFTTGSVKGSESVTVPAGTFHTRKVEIGSSRAVTGSSTEENLEPVRVQYRIWYASEVKRYVKMVRTTTSASGQMMDEDIFELLSFLQK